MKRTFITMTFIYTRRFLWHLFGLITILGLAYLLLPEKWIYFGTWLRWVKVSIAVVFSSMIAYTLIRMRSYAYIVTTNEDGLEFCLQSGQRLFVTWDEIVKVIVDTTQVNIYKIDPSLPITIWKSIWQCWNRIDEFQGIKIYIKNQIKPIIIDSAIDNDIAFFTLLKEKVPYTFDTLSGRG